MYARDGLQGDLYGLAALSGGFGTIYNGLDTFSKKQVVIKCNRRLDVFKKEQSILQALTQKELKGFPKLLSYGLSHQVNYMVLDMLGPDLKNLFK